MDVNNTRFHLLVGKRDWSWLLPELGASPADGPRCGVVWNEDRGCVNLRPLLYRFPKPEQLSITDRRGAARDRYGNWYCLGADETTITFLPCAGRQAQRFWPPLPADQPCRDEPCRDREDGSFGVADPAGLPETMRFRGMAVTSHHYLVVGVLEPPGLLIFDLHAGGPPVQVSWPLEAASASAPEVVPFAPFDMAPRSDGGVWILDFSPEQENPPPPRYWALDRYLRIESPGPMQSEPPFFQPDDFGPEEGGDDAAEKVRVGSVRLTPEMALALEDPSLARYPVAIEALPDDTVLWLDVDPETGATTVRRYAFERQLGETVSLREQLQDQQALGVDEKSGDLSTWEGYDFAFVPHAAPQPRTVEGTLYVVGRDGNQAFAFLLYADEDTLTLDLREPYFPLRRFGGKGLVAAEQTVYYDIDDRWLPVVAQPKPRFCQEGYLDIRVLDGKTPDCVWHRLLLDGCIPAGTSVRVQSRAANDIDLVAHSPWQDEPPLYVRGTGPEVPFYRSFSDEEKRREGVGTWELLFQQARGRYLQVRLTFHGTGRSTPRLYALRIHYPRFSYLREYLPDVYQEDDTSASFLDRFLSNLEGTFTELEGRIAEVQTLFDPCIVDNEYLDWLASWFGVLLDPAYTEAKRRLFIRHVLEIFNQRGTLGGLIRMIRLALDPCPDDSLFEAAGIACNIGQPQRCASSGQVDRYGVRIVESFLVRSVPGVVYGDVTDVPGPRLTQASATWTPAQGAEPLHRRYRDFLRRQHETEAALQQAWDKQTSFTFEHARLSPVPPAHDGQRGDWELFIRNELGFTYAEAGTDEDEALYRAYLRRRYRQASRLSDAYGRLYIDFDDVTLPAENDFPNRNPRLEDWIRFVSQALPLERAAHRFVVLVPTEPGSSITEQTQRLDLVRRIVEQEKPAHTEFDVRPYWALFRVGEARVGFDTLIDEGSRYVALLLGQGFLAGSHLGRAHPWGEPDRMIVGRDQLGLAS